MNLSTNAQRRTYALNAFDTQLEKEIISPMIFKVDTSNSRTIDAPFVNTTTTTAGAITDTYVAGTPATTDDTLTVNKQFHNVQNVGNFAQKVGQFDVISGVIKEVTRSVAESLDQWALNRALTDVAGSTASFATAAGGITKTNALDLIATIQGRLSGMKNLPGQNAYLVIENTELPAFLQNAAASGFAFGDKVLFSGTVKNVMNTDIFVARSGTFVSATVAGDAFTNVNRRLFGVKNMITLAKPSATREGAVTTYFEKEIDGFIGTQVGMVCYSGLKAWAPKLNMSGALTITA